MAIHKVTTYEYFFNKPKQPISEVEYLALKKTLPPVPENPTTATLKKYWGYLLLIPAFPIFLIFVFSGAFNEVFSYHSYIKEKNEFVQKYFHLIHISQNYQEFLEGYKKL